MYVMHVYWILLTLILLITTVNHNYHILFNVRERKNAREIRFGIIIV